MTSKFMDTIRQVGLSLRPAGACSHLQCSTARPHLPALPTCDSPLFHVHMRGRLGNGVLGMDWAGGRQGENTCLSSGLVHDLPVLLSHLGPLCLSPQATCRYPGSAAGSGHEGPFHDSRVLRRDGRHEAGTAWIRPRPCVPRPEHVGSQ